VSVLALEVEAGVRECPQTLTYAAVIFKAKALDNFVRGEYLGGL